MVIYLKHAKHGEKVAISDIEASHDEALGWARFDPSNKDAPALPDNSSIEELRAKWALKYGEKPHHKKSAETLSRELE